MNDRQSPGKNNFQKKFGFNISNRQPEDTIEYASAHGLEHIEINLSRDYLSIDKFDCNRIENLFRLSQMHQVKFSFHVPYFINISEMLYMIRRAGVSYLSRCIELASDLNATHITLHLGSFYWFPVEAWTRKKAIARFIKNLETILQLCEDKKLFLALENVVPIPAGSDYYLLGDNLNDFNFVFKTLESDYLQLCLDTGHANIAEGVMEYVLHFHNKLCCIHYHDNNGFNDEHLPVGMGSVPWAEFARQLSAINFDGPIISECRQIDAYAAAKRFNSFFD